MNKDTVLETIFDLAKISALVSATAMFIGFLYFSVCATRTLKDFDGTTGLIANVNKTIEQVNRPCGVNKQPCGTLADVNRTLATVRGMTGEAEVALNHENSRLYAMDLQEQAIYQDVHNTLTTGQETLKASAQLLNTANKTVSELQPVILESKVAIAGAETTLHGVDILLADPSIPITLQSVQRSSEQSAQTMANVNKTSKDVQEAVHGYLHPTFIHKTGVWGLRVLQAVKPW